MKKTESENRFCLFCVESKILLIHHFCNQYGKESRLWQCNMIIGYSVFAMWQFIHQIRNWSSEWRSMDEGI